METNLTAEQLLAGFEDGSLLTASINMAAFVAGLGVNVYGKMKAEDISFGEYWNMYGKNSVASIGTLATAFAGLHFMADAPIYAYFSVAYMSDSLVNKAPKNEEARALRK